MPLTDRDIQLLALMMCGPRTNQEIMEAMGEDPSRGAKRSPSIHRIRELERHDYVQSMRCYPRKRNTSPGNTYFVLNALTESAVYALPEEDYSPEQIRYPSLPHENFVEHERNVTRVALVVRQKSIEVPYDYRFLDEVHLRKLHHRKNKKKGEQVFADLRVILATNLEKKKKAGRFHIEVDMGSERAELLVSNKLIPNKRYILFLAKTMSRIERIAELCHKQGKTAILFALLKDFCVGGVFDTIWLDVILGKRTINTDFTMPNVTEPNQ